MCIICDLARKATSHHFYKNSLKIGSLDIDGNAKLVEIDESKFLKLKYNTCRIGFKISFYRYLT